MNDKNSPVGVGVVSIITVMFLMALSVFSILTLSSARADLALTQRGADNTKKYYDAETRAVELAALFAESEENELKSVIEISEMQGLSIHLIRTETGKIKVLEWQIILLQDFSEMPEDILNVWQ